MFTETANKIFNRAIGDYHRWDDVDHPIENPYEPGSLEHLLYHKNWIDTVQWHLEDIIRDPQIDPVAALAIKRRIDHCVLHLKVHAINGRQRLGGVFPRLSFHVNQRNITRVRRMSQLSMSDLVE